MAYIGKQPTIGNFVKLDTITTSATATYNLTNGGVAFSPQSPNHCIVSLNGVIQSPTSAYTISGSTIVFSDALTSSDVIDFILVLGDVLNIGTPSDATVGFAKVTSNLITGATSESTIAGGDQILIYDDSASALRKMTRTNFVSGIGGTNTPAWSVTTNGSAHAVTVNTRTIVQFNTENFDLGSVFNTTTYKATPTSGKYLLTANVTLKVTANTVNQMWIQIMKNSTTIAKQGYLFSTGVFENATGQSFDCSVTASANGTDTFHVEVYYYNGTAEVMAIDGNAPQNFSGIKIIE